MTFTQLTYFCAVCQYRSITRAAKSLYVSQPAVSTAIRNLEEEFHISLFYHGGNSVKLTAEGKNFYRKAQALVRRYQDFYSDFSSRDSSPFVIRLGVPAVLSAAFFPDLLLEFGRQHDTEVTLIEARTARSCRLVRSGEMDAAIVNLDFCDSELYNCHQMMQDQLVYYTSEKNPLARNPVLTFEDLKDEPLILYHSDSMLNDVVLGRFAAMKTSPHIILQSSQLLTVLRYITEYEGGAFLFNFMPIKYPGLIKIPLSPEITGPIGLIWKKGVYVNHRLSEFIDFVKDYRVPAVSSL